ncbi:MAG: NADH-quinone oxidoreductase subunit NuoH [Candidatus Dormibacteraeota bacterium]|nr:NADH-quinone oxidoreductase subunit NuoH [Candidatus Dormibacteraeota bacterium]
MVVFIVVLLTAAAYTVYYERRVLGFLQRRPGPNRVGPQGMLQLAADGIKLATKESIQPETRDKVLYVLAPAIMVAAAFLTWAVIPLGIWYGVYYWVADLNIGILLVFAVSSMTAYALLLGGWASNSKYSLLGGLRAAAQLVSYEMALGLSLVPIFMIVGSLRLQEIANFSVHWGPYNGPLPLIVVAPLSFVIYLMAAVAETNRIPFDLPEAEQELIGGYHTEYSGLKFTCFYLGEYVNMITVSTLASLIFLAGWHPTFPWLPAFIPFLAKIIFFLFLYHLVRNSFPRLRYDSLMRLGWKLLLPLAIANVVVTALILVTVT